MAVVIPVFNENKVVLLGVLDSLKKYNFDVILVDDGSFIPLELEASNLISIIRHSKNKGQGAALNTGTLKALELGYHYCAHFDGDGQHSASDLLRMFDDISKDNADILLGSRFLKFENSREIPLIKKLVLKGGVLLNFLLSGIWLTDSNCGIRMLNRTSMEKLHFKAERMAHASELLWLIKKYELKYSEFPVHVEYTDYSMRKGQNLYRIFPVTLEILRAYFIFRYCK